MPDNNQNVDNKRIAKNSLLLFVRMLFSMAVSLYTTRAILEILGITDFGIYNVVGGVIVFFGFLNQTMSTTTSRFITTALGKGNKESLHRVFCMSMNFHLILALLTFIIGESVGLWFVLYKLVIPVERLTAALWLYQATVLSTCIGVLGVPYNSTIIAHERMGAFAYISIFQVMAKLLIVLTLPFFTADKLVVFSLLTVGVSILVQFIYWQYSYRQFTETRFIMLWDKNIWNEMAGFASWNITGDLAFMCNTQGLNVLLNMFFGPVINAARGISVQVESVMLQFIGNFQTAISPQITKTYAAGNIEATRNLVVKASKFCFFLMMIIGIPLFIEMEYILGIWLNVVPAHTVIFAKLTIIMVAIDCLSHPLHLAIFATGKIRKYRQIQSSIYLAYLPISYMMLKLSDVSPDVILAILVLFKFFLLIICIERVNVLINLNTVRYLKETILPAISCLLLSYVLIFCLIHYLYPSFLRIFITGIVSMIISILVIFVLGLTVNERISICNQLKKIVYKYKY